VRALLTPLRCLLGCAASFASALQHRLQADGVELEPCRTFMKNMDVTPYQAIVNCMAVNHDDVTVAGYDNGALRFMGNARD
jgi:uncharacterized linocin/CFP29 family protein